MKFLSYFKSIRIPIHDKELVETFESLEDVLQQEHGSDGKHPIATGGNAGFMSAEHAQKIDEVWKWFQDNRAK